MVVGNANVIHLVNALLGKCLALHMNVMGVAGMDWRSDQPHGRLVAPVVAALDDEELYQLA